MQEHNKQYKDEVQELSRLKIWQENKAYVEAHNAAAEQHGFTLKLNKFSDLTNSEFVKTHNGYRMPKQASTPKAVFVPDPHFQVPSTVDWRDKGYVTGVKDQGDCGSCWAFSTTGALEGQNFKKTGKLVSLSEQNLIDCDTENWGCEGGDQAIAFKYIRDNGGIDTEKSYPYEEKQGKQCRYSTNSTGANCTGYIKLKRYDEVALANATASVGPISVSIDASHNSMMHYSSGVYYEPACSEESLDHAVLVVGYGTENGQDYWLVKNSWGTDWGENGYIKMARNRKNNCGIATEGVFPTV